MCERKARPGFGWGGPFVVSGRYAHDMNRTPALALLALAGALTITGCSPATTSAPQPSETAQEAAPTARDIVTIDDGIAWARGLDESASATELNTGIIKVGELVPDQDIWFDTSNSIGVDLIQLNAAVLASPDDAGSKVDDLNDIIDDLEAAIAKGNNP